MTLLITVITRDVGVFLLRSGISDISASGWGLFFFFPEPPLLVLSAFLALFRELRRISPGWSEGLSFGRLRFFGPGLLGAGLLCGRSLGLHL